MGGGEGVHDPGHDLGVGVHVGRGDVAVDAEHVPDGVGEAAGHGLNLAVAHGADVDGDAALGPTEGDVDERRLPRHERRQGPDLVEVGLRVVPDPALVGTAGAVVLDAIAREDAQLARVHAHRHLDADLPVRRLEHVVHLVLEMDEGGAAVEEGVDRFVGAEVIGHGAQRYARAGQEPGGTGEGAAGSWRRRPSTCVV